MKFFLLLFIVLFQTIFAFSPEVRELMASLHATCIDQTGLEESIIKEVNDKKFLPDNDKLKCYLKCLMEQVGGIDDETNEIDIEALIAVIPDNLKGIAEPIIRGCGAKKGKNSCESAWLTNQCYLETNPSLYFIF